MMPGELLSLYKVHMILGVVSSSISSLVSAALITMIIMAIKENTK